MDFLVTLAGICCLLFIILVAVAGCIMVLSIIKKELEDMR